CQQYNSFPLTV
nr:immunoglobulin light chain junction region [Macaca mulatta]